MDKNIKEQKINEEYVNLRKALKNIPEEKMSVATGLIENAAFMAVTLDELKENVNENGAICTYNRNPVESPAIKSYNTMINRYGNIMAQILALLPKEEQSAAAQEVNVKAKQLQKFISKKNDSK